MVVGLLFGILLSVFAANLLVVASLLLGER